MIPTRDVIVFDLSMIVDRSFAEGAIDSYVEMQSRFLGGQWQHTELDAGRLCEAVSRAVYQVDSGVVDHQLLPGKVVEYLIHQKDVPHTLTKLDRDHLSKAIQFTYKLRSERGAVHISPIHTANYMDSMAVVHTSKWILAEFLRLVWNKDQHIVGETIAQLVQMEHSIIHELDGVPMVLAVNLTTAEEVLVLLNHAPNNRLSRSSLAIQANRRSRQAITYAISVLIEHREVRIGSTNDIALTPIGFKRLSETILPKLP